VSWISIVSEDVVPPDITHVDTYHCVIHLQTHTGRTSLIDVTLQVIIPGQLHEYVRLTHIVFI